MPRNADPLVILVLLVAAHPVPLACDVCHGYTTMQTTSLHAGRFLVRLLADIETPGPTALEGTAGPGVAWGGLQVRPTDDALYLARSWLIPEFNSCTARQ